MATPPPPASPSPPPPFQPGDEVEVTMISDGFHGAWYEALVYSRDAAGLYLVVYKALADAVDASQHLREAVPGSQLRPRPPPTKPLPLALDQPIEAFYNDGWRPGVVWKLPGRQGVRDYEVLFTGTEDKFKCRAKLLRRPLEWVNGAWVPSAAQEKFNSAQKLGRATIVASKQSSRLFRGICASDNNTDTNNQEGSSSQTQLESFQLRKKAKKEETDEDTTLFEGNLGGFHGNFGQEFDDTKPITNGPVRDGVDKELKAVKRKKKNTTRKTNSQNERIVDLNASVRGDTVGDHQQSIVVNMPLVEGNSALRANLVTQGVTPVKNLGGHGISNMMVGITCSSQRGTSNAQYQNDEAPKVRITSNLVTPLSNDSHSTTIPLPFEKHSPMWKYIDTEVMPKMRQCPHFRPLNQYPEAQREGIAVGLMVTYAYLMSEKGNQKMESSFHLDENLKIIVDLEEHGFEVQHLRAHIEGLLRVKTYYEKNVQNIATEGQEFGKAEGDYHQNSILETSEIKEKSHRLDAELDASDRAVVALKQALDLFHERRTLLSKRKEEGETFTALLSRHKEEGETFTSKLQVDFRLAVQELASSVSTFQGILTALK